jgi:EAL domain-containing protein (putative c-di-GMP-specific phosphodiesterase class I)
MLDPYCPTINGETYLGGEVMAPTYPHPTPVGRACIACAGPVGRPTAEELWFYGHEERRGESIVAALTAVGATAAIEGGYVKAPVAGEVAPLLEGVATSLGADEQAAEKVAWIIAGTGAARAVAEGLTLRRLQVELRHRWFARLFDEQGLYMHFQPIVSLRRREVFAHEALVRAQHDGRELSGFEIVSTAAQAGLIVPLDARTRRTAITQFAEDGLGGKLFINFQPSAIYNPEFCLRTTFAAIERTALRPEDIVFEVVESEEIADTGHLLRIMRTYRDHGLGVAMDDFGVGYSTTERLLQLHPDYVKLDKALTSHVATEAAARERVAEIVRLATAEGCRVIAEGIEDVAQRDALRDLGCEFGQGYLFARPARRPQVTWPS